MDSKSVRTDGMVKFVIGWGAVFLFRFLLLPFRPPNIEPLMATMMPFSKRLGALASFTFAATSIAAYDAVTSGIGIWTLVTALAYGMVGIASHWYFASREARVRNFVIFGIVATILYDAATGLTIGPLFFHESFIMALSGQIPFTLLHLLGTVTFAVTLSPALYRWVVTNEALETSSVLARAS